MKNSEVQNDKYYRIVIFKHKDNNQTCIYPEKYKIYNTSETEELKKTVNELNNELMNHNMFATIIECSEQGEYKVESNGFPETVPTKDLSNHI